MASSSSARPANARLSSPKSSLDASLTIDPKSSVACDDTATKDDSEHKCVNVAALEKAAAIATACRRDLKRFFEQERKQHGVIRALLNQDTKRCRVLERERAAIAAAHGVQYVATPAPVLDDPTQAEVERLLKDY